VQYYSHDGLIPLVYPDRLDAKERCVFAQTSAQAAIDNSVIAQLCGNLGPLADAVGDLLAPPPVHHWYQSKWAWVAGGAAAAAIILVPITAAIAGSTVTAGSVQTGVLIK
jgi:hypothetical protein